MQKPAWRHDLLFVPCKAHDYHSCSLLCQITMTKLRNAQAELKARVHECLLGRVAGSLLGSFRFSFASGCRRQAGAA